MFRDATIAVGYPSPVRNNNERGLEVPFSLLPVLSRTYWLAEYNGKTLLKGYNSILNLVEQCDESVQWHLLVNKDQSRMSYTEGDELASLQGANEAFFSERRHFVGWAPSAVVLAGAQAGSYANIGRSLADSPRWMLEIHRGVSLQLQGGSYLNASIRCQLGKKDTPEHFENKPYWYYNQAMDNASRWPVVLSDVTTRQHWLVDGATTILQICQATLCSEDIRYTKKIVGDTLLRYSSGNGSPADSYGVLIDLGNRAERVDGSGRVTALDSPSVDLLHRGVPTFENIATAAYFRLEQLLDARHPAQSRENINIRFKQREFEGFEFNDLVEGQHRAEPKAISLYEEATEWYRFTKKIGTINLFGAGFGPLIMPMAAIDQVPAGGRGTHQMAEADAEPGALDLDISSNAAEASDSEDSAIDLGSANDNRPKNDTTHSSNSSIPGPLNAMNTTSSLEVAELLGNPRCPAAAALPTCPAVGPTPAHRKNREPQRPNLLENTADRLRRFHKKVSIAIATAQSKPIQPKAQTDDTSPGEGKSTPATTKSSCDQRWKGKERASDQQQRLPFVRPSMFDRKLG
ncbi:hypothetical protein LTR09_006461 [Extremus antarcticus]|uniref:Uncharacterized protein n=1 Tax=Extremus antarcticus TaxID=702011 RepID=A0AAJ0GBN5_9PEZI|nr:hypothetical protein LTR09_006461 [Extremus antarcticus]